MLEKYWIKCPICNGKTRVQVFYNTVLRNFPLFCPKCIITTLMFGIEHIAKTLGGSTGPQMGSLRVRLG